MKYLVLGWDYNDDVWVLCWWGTNRKEADKAYRDCEWPERKLVTVSTLTEQE